MKKSLFLTVCLASSLSLFNCGGGTKVDDKELAMVDEANKGHEVQKVDHEVIAGIIQAIPSPLEISSLIKESGGEYRKDFLNPAEKLNLYNTSYDQALNLGIYGVNLGYTNIYNKSQDGIYYLDAVSSLAESLNLGQFFDATTLRKLIKHDDNLDSLLLLTTSNFEKINMHLQEKNRSQLSVLLLVGGWIEGLNLLTEVNQIHTNDKIRERIGEQKDVLKLLIQLLSYFEHDENIQVVLKDLKELEGIYKTVKIEVIEGDVQMRFDSSLGMMIAEDSGYTKVHITNEQIGKIHASVKKIRKKIIK